MHFGETLLGKSEPYGPLLRRKMIQLYSDGEDSEIEIPRDGSNTIHSEQYQINQIKNMKVKLED